ncbi:MAG TPA: hypothetical protein VFB45_11365 [Pseudolabrys sp.]|nr:hypothetical protein [Pseudolabrys sp.]
MLNRKTTAAALLALALTTTLAASSAEAHPRFGWGIGAGIAAGALIGAAAASTYAEPVYVGGPVYRCHFVRRFDAWGYPHTVRVCDAY